MALCFLFLCLKKSTKQISWLRQQSHLQLSIQSSILLCFWQLQSEKCAGRHDYHNQENTAGYCDSFKLYCRIFPELYYNMIVPVWLAQIYCSWPLALVHGWLVSVLSHIKQQLGASITTKFNCFSFWRHCKIPTTWVPQLKWVLLH